MAESIIAATVGFSQSVSSLMVVWSLVLADSDVAVPACYPAKAVIKLLLSTKIIQFFYRKISTDGSHAKSG